MTVLAVFFILNEQIREELDEGFNCMAKRAGVIRNLDHDDSKLEGS